MYFQIPLMVLVILPAFEGLRPAWREAAENMGARTWQYWRHIGGPVLMPSFLGCLLLLFGSALSAYATAEALTSGTIPLTAIQIGSFLNGNVLAGQQNVGKALGLGMVVIIAVAHGLLRRAAAEGGAMAAVISDELAGETAPAAPATAGGGPTRSGAGSSWSLAAVYFLIPLYAALQLRRMGQLRPGGAPAGLRPTLWSVARLAVITTVITWC